MEGTQCYNLRQYQGDLRNSKTDRTRIQEEGLGEVPAALTDKSSVTLAVSSTAVKQVSINKETAMENF